MSDASVEMSIVEHFGHKQNQNAHQQRRGDQILNAESYKKQGFSTVLQEEELTGELLVSSVEDVYARRDEIKEKMASSKLLDANSTILDLILNA